MKKKYQNAFFLFGLAVLIIMITQLDFRQVWQGLQHAGYWFFAIVALWLFLYIINTTAWYVIIKKTKGEKTLRLTEKKERPLLTVTAAPRLTAHIPSAAR